MWKKFAKTKLSKISASAKDGDVILIEFDHNNISLEELQNWYNATSEKVCCPVVCTPKDDILLRNMTLDNLRELRDTINGIIRNKEIIEAKMKLIDEKILG